jgi:hypothetical protein
LSRSDRLRAIAERSRVARRGSKPSESMVRTYGPDGIVLSEHVLRGDKWVQRQSTLGADVSRAPLSDFLRDAQLRTSVRVDTLTWSDSTATNFTEMQTDSVNTTQLEFTNAPGVWGLHAAQMYYPSYEDVQDIHDADAITVYFANEPYGDVFEEVTLTGVDLEWYLNWEPSLRYSSVATRNIESLPCLSQGHLVSSISAYQDPARAFKENSQASQSLMLRPADPCGTAKDARVGSLVGLLGSLTVAAGCSYFAAFCGSQVPNAISAAWTAGTGFVVSAAAYASCRQRHPYGSF